jgi:deoxyribonuclease V
MILAVDVHYRQDLAVTGGVTFSAWTARREDAVYRSLLRITEAYIPGEFYRRELPCILRLLQEHEIAADAIVVDGFVYLDGFRTPGLGKHLFDALSGRTPVIGVAKSRFAQAPDKVKVYRGRSGKPLYVTSVGIPLATAKALIISMHGPYRVPSLLKKADHVSRMTNENNP